MPTTTEAAWTAQHAHEATQQPRVPEPLTDQEREILRVAGALEHIRGQREAAASRLGFKITSFWIRVNALIDDERALAAEPVLVNRLRRQREQRLAAKGHAW